MSGSAQASLLARDGEIELAVERLLGEHFGVPRRVARLERRPSEYATSSPLHELHVVLEDGTTLDLVLKDVSPGALLPGARDAKPPFLRDALREIAVYEHLLARAGLGTAICYGTLRDDARERYWLLLEDVPGVELYQVGEIEIWKGVARWLAGAHLRLGKEPGPGAARDALLRYDAAFYSVWARRAREFLPPAESRRLRRIVARYDAVVEMLLALPTTVIHGELYASNVIVDPRQAPPRVCAVDWETAAIGPGLIDLAALTSGSWSETARRELALAYHEALEPASGSPRDPGAFLLALDACRLHVAMQWLGWSPTWRPPREHEQDWLAEAIRAAERIGL